MKYDARLSELLDRLHALGREVIGPHADCVDRDARFPREAIDALKAEQLLSAYVPVEYGGMGLSIADISRMCEVLGQHCANTAMIFAMHQIQVACLVHHALDAEVFQAYARDLVANQYLLASATTEMGVGGDVRSSRCHAAVDGDTVSLTKQAPVISYGAHADGILVTCRRNAEAASNDQVHLLLRRDKGDFELEQLSPWDTLGFRGTCSNGFTLRAKCPAAQILPVPYGDIHGQTMHPFAHSVWASLWLGLATDAVARARQAVKAEARRNGGALPPSALRLAEVDAVLFSMRGGNHTTIGEYQSLLEKRGEPDGRAAFDQFWFVSRINNLKLTASTLVVDIVSRSMMITGIAGYRNDSKISLNRALRDSYGAALMVNNDRILGQSSSIQMLKRDE